jgi:hypothetical protein
MVVHSAREARQVTLAGSANVVWYGANCCSFALLLCNVIVQATSRAFQTERLELSNEQAVDCVASSSSMHRLRKPFRGSSSMLSFLHSLKPLQISFTVPPSTI